MPARPAIAARCTTPLVEPLIACSTIDALRSEAAVTSSLGRGPPAFAIATARVPVASAIRMRSEDTAGAVAAPGARWLDAGGGRCAGAGRVAGRGGRAGTGCWRD